MVSKIRELYQCKECGLTYKDALLAKKCEAYCKKYKSCSLKIAKHAVRK